MQKAFSKITWKNLPSTETALEAQNLNRIENGVDTIDNRVVSMDTSKANQTDLLTALKNIELNNETGVITVTRENNTTFALYTNLAKIAVNFTYNPVTQKLILTMPDGTTEEIDLSTLIAQYDFTDTATIHFEVNGGIVSASVIDGSITEAKLRPNYLADIRVESAKAESAAEDSLSSAHDSEAWAVGQMEGIDVPPVDPRYNNNSEYYATQAASSASDAEQSKQDAADILEQVQVVAGNTVFTVDFETGDLVYTNDTTYDFSINTTTGNLEWEVIS